MKLKIKLPKWDSTGDAAWSALHSVLQLMTFVLPGDWKIVVRAIDATCSQLRLAVSANSDGGSKITEQEIAALVEVFRAALVAELS